MAEPPPYEEDDSSVNYSQSKSKASHMGPPHRFSICEEVGTSRSQHVAAIVAKLEPRVRDRARAGLSKSTLLLLPSDQAVDSSRKGQLVGFDVDEPPIIVQLESRQDRMEFWAQDAALMTLRQQFLAAISSDIPALPEPVGPTLPNPPATNKSSWLGRKQSKTPNRQPSAASVKPPVTVQVSLDEAHFRSETEYGLYQTLRGRCVLVVIELRTTGLLMLFEAKEQSRIPLGLHYVFQHSTT
nr:hypothetical protein CFP56_73018 [Quercus suber]